jgi:hypothetical protein
MDESPSRLVSQSVAIFSAVFVVRRNAAAVIRDDRYTNRTGDTPRHSKSRKTATTVKITIPPYPIASTSVAQESPTLREDENRRRMAADYGFEWRMKHGAR